jgi:DNA-directed RNA polymerase subunit RPC12/RpoP
MSELYYCVKCKKKTEMKDAQHITMKNGKPALKGQCVVCGTTVNAIQGTKGKQS